MDVEWSITKMTEAVQATAGWLTVAEAVLLHQMSRNAGTRRVVELGAYQGRSTIALASGRAGLGLPPMLTIDTFRGSSENQPGGQHYDPSLLNSSGDIDTFPAFRSSIDHYQLTHSVEVWRTTTTEAAANFSGEVGLLFVDADHSYVGVSADLRSWLPHVTPGGAVILHDVGDRPGPTRAAADLLQQGYKRLEQRDTALALQLQIGGMDKLWSYSHG